MFTKQIRSSVSCVICCFSLKYLAIYSLWELCAFNTNKNWQVLNEDCNLISCISLTGEGCFWPSYLQVTSDVERLQPCRFMYWGWEYRKMRTNDKNITTISRHPFVFIDFSYILLSLIEVLYEVTRLRLFTRELLKICFSRISVYIICRLLRDSLHGGPMFFWNRHIRCCRSITMLSQIVFV